MKLPHPIKPTQAQSTAPSSNPGGCEVEQGRRFQSAEAPKVEVGRTSASNAPEDGLDGEGTGAPPGVPSQLRAWRPPPCPAPSASKGGGLRPER